MQPDAGSERFGCSASRRLISGGTNSESEQSEGNVLFTLDRLQRKHSVDTSKAGIRAICSRTKSNRRRATSPTTKRLGSETGKTIAQDRGVEPSTASG